MKELGKWALIDIETTGIDANYDAIIDIGFLQFEGTKLVRTYSSLVQTDVQLSQFIQKLTGIKQNHVNNAPSWSKVEFELLTLEGHALIAHNASFEEKFLKKYFDRNDQGGPRESFQDSMYLLALLFPEKSTLNLESFLIELKVSEKEEHRGLSDSKDLLKVMLMGARLLHKASDYRIFLINELENFTSEEFWFKNFLRLTIAELNEIADQIDFDLEYHLELYVKAIAENNSDKTYLDMNYPLSFSGENLKHILEDEKKIKENIPHYKFRKPQEDLSLRVGQAFKNGIHALIQAPTGTGKTLGYLLPSALFAMENKEQVLIATGTKALQSQAISKDIPQLRTLLGVDETKLAVSVLVGSSNHICELLYRNSLDNEMLIQMRTFEEKYAYLFFEVYFFLNQMNQKIELNRENIPFVLKRLLPKLEEVDKASQVDYRACTGNLCPFKDNCTYQRGLRAAREAHIIIGNHSLMLNWPRSFPRPQYVVVDEAHRLENEATRAYTVEIAEKEFENFSRNLLTHIGSLFYLIGQLEAEPEKKTRAIRDEVSNSSSMLLDHIAPLKDIFESFFKKQPRYTDIYWNEIKMQRKDEAREQSAVAIRNHLESLATIYENTFQTLLPFHSRYDIKQFENDKHKVTAFTAFESTMATIEDYAKGLRVMVEEDELFSRAIKFHEEFGFKLEAAPIDVGNMITKNLLELSTSTVFTSATLANSKGTQGVAGVEWMTGYSYLPQEKRFRTGLYLEEVFDYKAKTRVFLSTDVPSIYDTKYVDVILQELIPVMRSIGGRTLLLFSSKVRFDRAIEILLEKLEGEIPLFIQGMGHQVVDEFKRSKGGVLVGMESFGEGIDVPGEALCFVVIDKVPDIRQELVIQERRDFYEKSFGNEFTDYFLSHRTRSLHQKLGRLIRTENDWGAALIIDPRLKSWKGRTLSTFRSLMEPYDLQILPLKDSCAEVEKFITERIHR